jgi:hypothetical protein
MRSLAWFGVVASLGVVGCAEDEPVELDFGTPVEFKLQDNALSASHALSDAIMVEESTLRVKKFPWLAAELAQIEAGKVIAGDRSSLVLTDGSESNNGTGFLRKVVSKREEGEFVVIETAPADMEEWIAQGDLSLMGESLFGTQALSPAQLNVLGASPERDKSSKEATTVFGEERRLGNAAVKAVFKTSNVSFKLRPDFDGNIQVRKKWFVPVGVKKAWANLNINPILESDIEMGVLFTSNDPKAPAPDAAPLEKRWKGTAVKIPIPGAAIPTTVEFAPTYDCSMEFTGKGTAKMRATVSGSATVGFSYEKGTFTNTSKEPTFSANVTSRGGVGLELSGSAECTVQLAVRVLLFDAAGIEGRVGPYINLGATGCGTVSAPKFELAEEHGMKLNFDARVQIPKVGAGENFPLFEKKFLKSTNYLVGNANTCK